MVDAVLVRQSVAVSGITGVALTKLDVLDGFEEIKICTAYRLDGKIYDDLPPHPQDQDHVEPIYETIEGWSESTAGAQLGPASRPGDQIYPPRRRVDPMPGDAGVDQPGA